MNFVSPDLSPAYAEMFVLTMTCLVLVVDAFLRDSQRGITYTLSMLTLVGAAVITSQFGVDARISAFSDHFISDPMGDILKLVVYATTAVVFLYSRDYLRRNDIFHGEFFVLALFAMLGIMVMVSAGSLLSLYLGLELLSLSLYALVAFQRTSTQGAEAAMKYFVLGAIASGCLLYGISLLYGMTGTISLSGLAENLTTADQFSLPLLFGLAFVVVGLAFKFGAVPFHAWVPDVYQGAPTAVTLFIASAPKIAAFALAIRLLVDGLGDLQGGWQDMLTALAVLSIVFGNLVAIVQTNIKRMLAYSTISHVGFILLGILTGSQEGYAAAMYYTIAYVVMTTGAFGMIMVLSRKGFEVEQLDDFKGLNTRSPWLAGLMLMIIFSMAGIPPFVGFYAKLTVLMGLVEVGLTWLAVLALVFSVVGAFYYLRVVKLMYFDDPLDQGKPEAATDIRVLLSANAILVLLLGVFPDGLMSLCIKVFQ
ncbi:MAG: NADH-quinone oxidoreductase subunit NuoN [Gammaproteobacteria bacterium]|jgi:NADH-quinone oxidoreductase subunit N|nr:NADH-quinone oxidoreductase subunit NuoN [Gammaproteobacteria bacterium]